MIRDDDWESLKSSLSQLFSSLVFVFFLFVGFGVLLLALGTVFTVGVGIFYAMGFFYLGDYYGYDMDGYNSSFTTQSVGCLAVGGIT